VSAEFDFRQTGPQSWDIVVEAERETLVLSHGGNALACDGVAMELPPEQEYDTMYRRFAELVRGGMSEADLAPLIIVADAFLCGEIRQTEPFHY
ncbi:MAG TPA: gfo/Idh/MocA family oxidoreductase, partial [Reyranella sp.]|nr:gfo/Idh/MocA family oxidoreductase [Reyranella sp.]